VIVAEGCLQPFSMPFRRNGCGESISIDFASAVVGHHAIRPPDFAICDMGYSSALADEPVDSSENFDL